MCIFCKIVQGEIPCYKVYEDEDVLAFLDISQVTKGHTLVIPKKHFDTVFSLEPEISAKIFVVTQKITQMLQSSLRVKDLNILNNSGPLAGQEVNHFHLHIIPIYQKGDVSFTFSKHQFTTEEMIELSQNIKNSGN